MTEFYIDLGYNDVIPHGKYKGITVAEALSKDGKDGLITLLKEANVVTDDVLADYNMHRVVHEPTIKYEFVDKKPIKDNKVYAKETMSKEKILQSILTLDNDDWVEESEKESDESSSNIIDDVETYNENE